MAPALERTATSLGDPRDRALLHELVLGTLRRRGWLDHVLAHLSSRPLDTLAPAGLRRAAARRLPAAVPAHARPRRRLGVGRPRARGGAPRGRLRERDPATPAARGPSARARPGAGSRGLHEHGGLAPALAGRALARPSRRDGRPGPHPRRTRSAADVRAAQPSRRFRARRARGGRRGARADRGAGGVPREPGCARPVRRARHRLRAGRGLPARGAPGRDRGPAARRLRRARRQGDAALGPGRGRRPRGGGRGLSQAARGRWRASPGAGGRRA